MKRNKNNKNTIKNYSESILTILKEDHKKFIKNPVAKKCIKYHTPTN